MDFSKLTYDISRHYLEENKPYLADELYNKLKGLLRARCIAKLATCTKWCDPVALSSLDGRRTLMQIEAFFKKNAIFSSADCEKAARQTFLKAETQCRITNKRLDYYYVKRDRLDPDLNLWLSRMESDISDVLGPFDTFLQDLPEHVRITAGATATKSRRESLPPLRVSKRLHCTHSALPYLDSLSRFFGYGGLKPVLLSTNRIEFVPKNFETHRTIACEAEGNSCLQLAFDAFAKRRLRRIGVNLSNQVLNQEEARLASMDGRKATVDMKTASDTEAYNCVAWLFPKPWFDFLRAVRAPFGKFDDGTVVRYAKFSSMGNGTTFTTETLIFACACRAVGSKGYSVYGDDIIIEVNLLPALEKLLRFLGFRINVAKSFSQGPFRESCGTNWFSGVDITPIYIRDLDRRKAVLCHLVNTLASICVPDGPLGAFLRGLVHEVKLPLVPFNLDTMSGVWIPVHSAYSLGLIRIKGSLHTYKAFVLKGTKASYIDSRSLFLWHLRAMTRRNDIVVPIETSGYTLSGHKYVRTRIHWISPVAGTPVHLYWWAESILRES